MRSPELARFPNPLITAYSVVREDSREG